MPDPKLPGSGNHMQDAEDGLFDAGVGQEDSDNSDNECDADLIDRFEA